MILVVLHTIFVVELLERDNDLLAVHRSGYDLVFLLILWSQILIRTFMISLKYGTYTEKQYDQLFLRVWTKDENYH